MTDPSHDAPDDGFHEIQLSGKQLVFLFMATTVVSVVIFLCGVLVGRGVRGEPLSAAGNAVAPLSTGGPGASLSSPAAPPPPVVDSSSPATASLSYNKRLESETPVAEAVKPSAPETVAAAAAPPSPTVEKAPIAEKAATGEKSPPAEKTAPKGEPSAPVARAQAGVWAVQVVALTDRAAATAVVERLSHKGYPAFLVQPQPGAAVQNYKVQVGKFEDRSQAEQIAGRLKKEEQFQPWILR